MTPTATARMQATRDDCAQRSAEHGHRFSVDVSEDDARDLASGYVPAHVQAMLLTMLEWQAIDRRRAARPIRKRSK